jgi:hypothetical protein
MTSADNIRPSSYWLELARGKLVRVLGPSKGAVVLDEVLESLGLETLSGPEDLARFGEQLGHRGGFMSALGAALQTQALLHRARANL